MKLFDIILKLIQHLNLVGSEEHTQLRVDVREWEDKAQTAKEKTKLQELYCKLHQGVFFRLAAPFLFVFLTKYVQDILNGKEAERDQYLD